ncbi:DUF2924 domain-containing protein [Sphingomonas prati]|uniref:DUF2924 domain-containing protein n=1 Tax=Sphingomonas prati TaxID=1843237 RepID=A0A7W9BVQ2_9SPHN|nr:DUF2924 domain-containing protein [Sphingomonas prati]MBB5730992.1 hypothetical protein [Sphingomonas prati]GGE98408.1 hypothetical protein GCM10011404_34460 [Sphingomonas prati]
MRIEEKLARLATLSPAELRAEWMHAYKVPAPRLSPDLLRLGIAYRLQEKAYGKLPTRVARSLTRPAAAAPHTIKPGTQLVRSWNGRTIDVLATESGFMLDGHSYRSLSAIARHVTGTAWSGPRFFGLNADG